MAKMVVSDGLVYVNGEMEMRRGRKLYPGDVVEFMGEKDTIEKDEAHLSE